MNFPGMEKSEQVAGSGEKAEVMGSIAPLPVRVMQTIGRVWLAMLPWWLHGILAFSAILILLTLVHMYRIVTETVQDFAESTLSAACWLAVWAALKNLAPASAALWKYWYAGSPVDTSPPSIQDTNGWDSYVVASVIGTLTTAFGLVFHPAPHT